MFLRVPCGKCKECIKSNQDDWFIRALFEFKRVRSIGGDALSFVLTYNEDNLPIYKDPEFNFECLCFDHSHIKKFRDKLRVYLKRLGYPATQMRFIMTPEFGGKKGRPHIHVQLYMPFHVPLRKVVNVIDKKTGQFKRNSDGSLVTRDEGMIHTLERAWIYGFVSGSPKHGWYLSSIKGVQYNLKYVSKPQLWLDTYNIPDYEKKLKDLASKEFETTKYKDKLSEFRKVSPRHFQSLFFGLDGINYFRSSDGSFDIDKLKDGTLSCSKLGFFNLSKDSFFMPRYYFKKIFTYMVDGISYKNDLYFKTFPEKFENQIVSRSTVFASYLQSPDLVFEHLKPLNKYTLEDCIRFDRDIFSFCRNPRELAVFDAAYKDMPLDCMPDLPFTDNKDFVLKSTLLDSAFDFLFTQDSSHSDPVPEKMSVCLVHPELFTFDRPLFNDLQCFLGWSDIIDFIDLNEKELSKLRFNKFKKDEIARARLFGHIH